MKYRRMVIENFRKFKGAKFSFGKRITVISGINGIGKSSLLALIASTTGIRDKRLNGMAFQPEFTDSFTISPKEPYGDYRIYLEFDQQYGPDEEPYYLVKRISFKNDEKSKRGIRPIPRTYSPLNNNDRQQRITVSVAQKDSKSGSGRIHVPTEYISLSRLLPLGETETVAQKVSDKSGIYQNGDIEFFTECYNSVLYEAISKEDVEPKFITKGFGDRQRKYLSLKVKQTTDETLSVGQDNLEVLVSSLTDFYALKKKMGDKYPGGVLCIDEIDSSLHPSAIVNLMKLIEVQAEELNVQVIMTTHSLIVLKEIIRLSNENPDDYKLVYFVDNELPRAIQYTNYETLKADMFGELKAIEPKIKVYCEDNITAEIFKLLRKCLHQLDNYQDEAYKFEIIGVSLGKDHLRKLTKEDNYFGTTINVLDGDARLKKDMSPQKALEMDRKIFESGLTTQKAVKNILYLPTFYAPEVYLYKIIEEYTADPAKHASFWTSLREIEEFQIYTPAKIREKYNLHKKSFNKIHGNDEWNESLIEFMDKSGLLEDYYSDYNNKKELKEFYKHYKEAVKAADTAKKRSFFE